MSQSPGPPPAGEFAPYYAKYVSLVPAGDLLAQLERQGRATAAAWRALTPAEAAARYAPGKWSVAEVLGHIIDAERIFAYRALRIGRGDETPLPGFDQDRYAPAGAFDRRTPADIVEEFESVRRATLTLFRGLPAEAWMRRGSASDQPVTVRALAHIIAGHELHHLGVLRDKYGLPASAG
jgi:uncharacterized damage-inducible protein DinB